MEASERVVERVAGLESRRAAGARVVVEVYRRSGWTAASFARRYGIKVKRLRRWARELEGEVSKAEALRFHSIRCGWWKVGANRRREASPSRL